MGCADDDSAGIGKSLDTRNTEEWGSGNVHCRPDGVGAKAKEELEDTFVGLCADMSETAFVIGGITPMTQGPVLVVEEYSTIFNACRLCGGEILVDG